MLHNKNRLQHLKRVNFDNHVQLGRTPGLKAIVSRKGELWLHIVEQHYPESVQYNHRLVSVCYL